MGESETDSMASTGNNSTRGPKRVIRNTDRMQNYKNSIKRKKGTIDEKDFEECIHSIEKFLLSDDCPADFKNFFPLFSNFAALVAARLDGLEERKCITRKDLAGIEIKQAKIEEELADCRKREAELVQKIAKLTEENERSVKEFEKAIITGKERAAYSKPATGEAPEEFYRQRSIVLSGLALPIYPNRYQSARALHYEVERILGYLDVPYIPVDVFAMGKHLVKIRFGTKAAQEMVLARASRLRSSDEWYRCFLRPSLTEKQRAERAENLRSAKSELQRRKEGGEDLVIRSLPNGVTFELSNRRSRFPPTFNQSQTHSSQQNQH